MGRAPSSIDFDGFIPPDEFAVAWDGLEYAESDGAYDFG